MNCAIRVVNGTKWYYPGEPVLNGLSMTVKPGSIYGLLGQSGGGKTTLLRCIMGLRRLNSGYISLFGHDPQDSKLRKMIGYMPQDNALYELMKISEVFEYYGVLAGLSHEDTKQRTRQLVQLLRLPNGSKLINSLSGGQKRRVSLGIGLIAGDKLRLLILDEPTVGNDALIKQEIWNYLRELVNGGMTILLTTHCTSEAGLCDRIGLLRSGKLIAEEHPKVLLKNCGVSLLDEAMLLICQQSEKEKKNETQASFNLIINQGKDELEFEKVVTMVDFNQKTEKHETAFEMTKFQKQNDGKGFKKKLKRYLKNGIEEVRKLLVISKRHILYQQIRQPLILIGTFLFPFIQVLLVLLIVSQDPKGQKLNLINYETNCVNQSELLSCKFLRHLNLETQMLWKETKTIDSAISDLNFGSTVGYLQFPANFTENLLLRLSLKRFAQKNELEGSNLKIDLDTSNPVVFHYLFYKILDSLQFIYREVAKEFGVDEKEVKLPLKFNSLYNSGSHWIHYFVPPIGILATFSLNLGWAGINHSQDLSTGSAERNIVGGSSLRHLLFSYYFAGTFTMLGQAAITYATYLAYFGFQELAGSLWLIFLLCVLSGYVGTSFGLLLATYLQNTLQVVIAAMFVVTFVIYTCGLTFAIESIPYGYRALLNWGNPITGIYTACRVVWLKGYGISHPIVLQGMSVSILWLFAFSLLCIIISRKQNV